jgi:transposase
MKKRNSYSPEFKAKPVIEVLMEEKTISEIATENNIHQVILSRWKTEFLERSADVFKKGKSTAEQELEESKEYAAELERKIGQLTYEVDWMKKKSTQLESIRRRKK